MAEKGDSKINQMTNENATTIYPCPFSKGYGMPASQAWQLLKIYGSGKIISDKLHYVFCINL
ncbi:MAG: hypothetical protein FJ190_12020 [Gammaproteobacteria bacterium]|nr:hypothetical protein [Gammaproteobacteria bacterium]